MDLLFSRKMDFLLYYYNNTLPVTFSLIIKIKMILTTNPFQISKYVCLMCVCPEKWFYRFWKKCITFSWMNGNQIKPTNIYILEHFTRAWWNGTHIIWYPILVMVAITCWVISKSCHCFIHKNLIKRPHIYYDFDMVVQSIPLISERSSKLQKGSHESDNSPTFPKVII